METARIKIQGEGIRSLTAKLSKKEDIYYKYETKDVVILLDEEYYYRNESNLMTIYIIEFKDETTLQIEVVAGGGSGGLSDWGAEASEMKKLVRTVLELCKENNWEVVEVYPEEFKNALEKSTTEKFKESVFSWFKR